MSNITNAVEKAIESMVKSCMTRGEEGGVSFVEFSQYEESIKKAKKDIIDACLEFKIPHGDIMEHSFGTLTICNHVAKNKWTESGSESLAIHRAIFYWMSIHPECLGKSSATGKILGFIASQMDL